MTTTVGAACDRGAEQVQLSLPLDKNGAYQVDQLLEQCNRSLDTHYPIEQYRGRKRLLTPLDRAALLLASEVGLADVQITPDRLVLQLRDGDAAEQRRQARRWLIGRLRLPPDYWGANHGLQVPADFDPRRRTLLVIHGLEAAPTDLVPFERACRATNIQLLTFFYPNDGPLVSAGRRLNRDLDKLAREHPQMRLSVVGLSMGGLVARHGLETPGMHSGVVSDLFLLGTPNHGSALAREYGIMELLLQVLPQGMNGLGDALSDGLGEAADDLEPGSKFLTALNALPRATNVRYHVGIGTRSFLSATQHERLAADLGRIFAARDVPAATQRELLTLLSADEVRDGQADGAVTVESARLTGSGTERVFGLNHLELISLSGDRPEQSEVFGWILAEMGWPAVAEHGATQDE